MKQNNETRIRAAVDEFFGRNRHYVYATPDTDNHSANFYGDTYVCRLSRRDVVNCITVALAWNFDGEDEPDFDRVATATRAIIDDLQFEKPEYTGSH